MAQQLAKRNLETTENTDTTQSSGFTLGLGLGMLIGAVSTGLLMSGAGSDLVQGIETKASEYKDKATEYLQNTDLKAQAKELLNKKASETITNAMDSAAQKLGLKSGNGSGGQGKGQGQQQGQEEKQMAGAGAGGGSKSKGSSGGSKSGASSKKR